MGIHSGDGEVIEEMLSLILQVPGVFSMHNPGEGSASGKSSSSNLWHCWPNTQNCVLSCRNIPSMDMVPTLTDIADMDLELTI